MHIVIKETRRDYINKIQSKIKNKVIVRDFLKKTFHNDKISIKQKYI